MRRLIVAVVSFAVLALMSAGIARADKTYHSGHYDFSPVSGAPLRSGFIENIHANGPNVYAHEHYVVNGAQPSTTYQAVVEVFRGDTSCNSTPLVVPTAQLTTNVAGNGSADHVFTPADADGLRGTTDGVIWLLKLHGAPIYTTGCQTVQFD